MKELGIRSEKRIVCGRAGNDVIEVVGVSSDSEVFSRLPCDAFTGRRTYRVVGQL